MYKAKEYWWVIALVVLGTIYLVLDIIDRIPDNKYVFDNISMSSKSENYEEDLELTFNTYTNNNLESTKKYIRSNNEYLFIDKDIDYYNKDEENYYEHNISNNIISNTEIVGPSYALNRFNSEGLYKYLINFLVEKTISEEENRNENTLIKITQTNFLERNNNIKTTTTLEDNNKEYIYTVKSTSNINPINSKDIIEGTNITIDEITYEKKLYYNDTFAYKAVLTTRYTNSTTKQSITTSKEVIAKKEIDEEINTKINNIKTLIENKKAYNEELLLKKNKVKIKINYNLGNLELYVLDGNEFKEKITKVLNRLSINNTEYKLFMNDIRTEEYDPLNTYNIPDYYGKELFLDIKTTDGYKGIIEIYKDDSIVNNDGLLTYKIINSDEYKFNDLNYKGAKHYNGEEVTIDTDNITLIRDINVIEYNK